jgi:hypothetical protein
VRQIVGSNLDNEAFFCDIKFNLYGRPLQLSIVGIQKNKIKLDPHD